MTCPEEPTSRAASKEKTLYIRAKIANNHVGSKMSMKRFVNDRIPNTLPKHHALCEDLRKSTNAGLAVLNLDPD
jgi:hypothetical protein